MRKIKNSVHMRLRKIYPTFFIDQNVTLNNICEYLEAIGIELFGKKAKGVNRGSFYDLFNGRNFSNEVANKIREQVINHALGTPTLTLNDFLTKKRAEYEQKPKGGAGCHKKRAVALQ